MKEVKKEKTTVEYITFYEAADGTLFKNEEECKKYEDSAAAFVLKEKTKEFEVVSDLQLDIFDGSENQYCSVKPRNEKDIDILNQLWFLFGGKGRESLFSKDDIDTYIIIGWRIYNTSFDWLWFHKLNDIIKGVTGDEQ